MGRRDGVKHAPMPFASFLLRASIVGLLLSQGAFASVREEGGGGMDGGGGGTFISCANDKQIVFFDLLYVPGLLDPNLEGDKLRLSEQGKAIHGEWIPADSLTKSTQLMNARLAIWKRPLLPLLRALAFVEKIEGAGPKLMATDLSIQRVQEVAISLFENNPSCENPTAIPGAYFDYKSEIAFIDIKLWNQIDLSSQAAMLLHERLRKLQKYYPRFSNNDLQLVVAQVMALDPGPLDIRLKHFHKKIEPKDRSHLDLRNAPEVMASAVRSGILGLKRGDKPLAASGLRNAIDPIGGEVQIEPYVCGEMVNLLRARKALTGTLACNEQRDLEGEGIIKIGMSYKYEYTIDLHIALLSDGAQTTAELLRVGRSSREGFPISFTRIGSKIEVRLGRVSPVVQYVDLPNVSEKKTFNITVSKITHDIRVVLNPQYEDGALEGGNEVLIAKVRAPKVSTPRREGGGVWWSLHVGKNALIGYVRTINNFDPNMP